MVDAFVRIKYWLRGFFVAFDVNPKVLNFYARVRISTATAYLMARDWASLKLKISRRTTITPVKSSADSPLLETSASLSINLNI
jgi:hypothetical protein